MKRKNNKTSRFPEFSHQIATKNQKQNKKNRRWLLGTCFGCGKTIFKFQMEINCKCMWTMVIIVDIYPFSILEKWNWNEIANSQDTVIIIFIFFFFIFNISIFSGYACMLVHYTIVEVKYCVLNRIPIKIICMFCCFL